MEYALGTEPLVANASPIIHDLETMGADQYLRLTIPKNSAATNLTYTVEVCGDLAAPSWDAAQTTVETNSATQLSVRDNVRVSSASRRFIRLKVSVTPP